MSRVKVSVSIIFFYHNLYTVVPNETCMFSTGAFVHKGETTSSTSSQKFNVHADYVDVRDGLGMCVMFHDWRFTANHFVLATSPLRLATCNFIFQLNTCGYSPYVTSSLTREGSGDYNCCWYSPALSFPGQSLAGLMNTLCSLRFETVPIWGPGPHIYVPQDHGGPIIPPGTGFVFRCLVDSQGYDEGIRPCPHTEFIKDSISSNI
jgi:hypothetical protein